MSRTFKAWGSIPADDLLFLFFYSKLKVLNKIRNKFKNSKKRPSGQLLMRICFIFPYKRHIQLFYAADLTTLSDAKRKLEQIFHYNVM